MILTTREPGVSGAIAKYLAKYGDGIQQVEFRCSNVDRATQILKDKFGVALTFIPLHPHGADGTRSIFPRRLSGWGVSAHRNYTNYSLAR